MIPNNSELQVIKEKAFYHLSIEELILQALNKYVKKLFHFVVVLKRLKFHIIHNFKSLKKNHFPILLLKNSLFLLISPKYVKELFQNVKILRKSNFQKILNFKLLKMKHFQVRQLKN